jgi:uncharacterized protein
MAKLTLAERLKLSQRRSGARLPSRGRPRPEGRGGRDEDSSPGNATLAAAGFSRMGELVWVRRVVKRGLLPAVLRHSINETRRSAENDRSEAGFERERLAFLDLETTGLSGGAGTVAFLCGIGYHAGEDFVFEQYFLADYPGERDFLEALIGSLRAPRDAILVTYNGRAFDIPLLRTRLSMNGMRIEDYRQADLLYPSRRLFKRRLGSARLADVGEAVLGLSREGDVPGAEVPERYFDFLKTGSVGGLLDVFRHNELDVEGLARLCAFLEGVFSFPLTPGSWPGSPSASDSVDGAALGLALLRAERGEGETVLRAALEGGDRKAGSILASWLKARGRRNEAVAVWTALAASAPDVPSCVELAKYCEHRSKDVEAALAWTERALACTDGGFLREGLERRRARLLKKRDAARPPFPAE